MFQTPTTIDALINEAEELHLYFKLIEQTNKDFASDFKARSWKS